MLLFILIVAVIVIAVVVKGDGFWATKTRNSIHEWAVHEEGYCNECKYCVIDKAHEFSQADYYCRLAKCNNITKSTRMTCFERPTVTEEDMRILFTDIGIWTPEGQKYIRDSLLGKQMCWSEIDAFLSALPQEHPEYIDRDKVAQLDL